MHRAGSNPVTPITSPHVLLTTCQNYALDKLPEIWYSVATWQEVVMPSITGQTRAGRAPRESCRPHILGGTFFSSKCVSTTANPSVAPVVAAARQAPQDRPPATSS